MAEFIQNLDPRNLVVLETALSFLISTSSAPVYNFPLFLFGVYAQDSGEGNQSLNLFTVLLGGSMLLDIIWLASHEQHWFSRLLTIIILVVKAPTFLCFMSALRQRGEHLPGFGSGDLNGATVWTMPGGLSSGRNGYEHVGDRDVEALATPRAAPVVQVTAAAQPAPSSVTNPPGSYQAM